MAQRKVIVVIKNGKAIAASRSARGIARELFYIGKSHVWYSRKLSNADSFLLLFEEESYFIQKLSYE